MRGVNNEKKENKTSRLALALGAEVGKRVDKGKIGEGVPQRSMQLHVKIELKRRG